ncbi:FtsK/SpoIIIE family DNA translocase [Candidatus Pelagibacter communis]|uniref:FtsK/SpoIIIE family DNA translocase n=1 Tax=Pelagibacter ubique TaxID=198252 RepID=UPI00094CB372|nr:DNA translocase FtsK [Candidatus Pelagibacter ubique]
MNLKIKNIDLKAFIFNRLIEIFAIGLFLLAILLSLAVVTYTPDDPNFIFSEGQKVKNLLGINGSIISDFFFQSVGLISYFIPITIIFSAINIFFKKTPSIIVNNIFLVVCYSLIGTFFLSVFLTSPYFLYINGNGGFVGNFLNESFFLKLEFLNNKITYYFSLITFIILFVLSLNPNSYWIKIFIRKKKGNQVKDQIISQDPQFKEKETVQETFNLSESISEPKKVGAFKLPSLDFLKVPEKKVKNAKEEKKVDADFLEKVLLDFGVQGKITKISTGPVVTLNEFEPAAGVKVSKIVNLSEDIARNTSSESARISTIPGSSTIGIELPNSFRDNVMLREIISSPKFNNKDLKLPIALGKSISGQPLIGDLTSMPHLLIAGTTGSGKSVCINTIILSLLYRHKPEICKFILIDPKMLELSTYEGIPHLLCPVITEAKKAASVLGWVVKEMENRYKLMTKVGVRNIDSYNAKHKISMPYIVVIVDEMSDLMLVASKDIENCIQKLSQMARAAGIHIIMATQRPSVDVITGTIKANFPTRISFQVSSKIDSRTILGEQGAEQLLGKGDMLYMSSANRITRIHAPFVSDNEIEKINSFLKSQGDPEYVDEILNLSSESPSDDGSNDSDQDDELYNKALEIVKSEGKASTSFLQRKLQIGYNRAARIIDIMESRGVVSKANHVGKRELL